MNKCKRNSWTAGLAAVAVVATAFSTQLAGQTVQSKPVQNSGLGARLSVQVQRIDPGHLELAHSFQIAIYENLLDELNRKKGFKQVLREGDSRAAGIPDLLILKTMVVKYTPGSETQRAVTTVSGATKLTVRSRMVTRDGKIILDCTVNGNVRFFGSNLRATQNLARNIAKAIQQSASHGSEQPAQAVNPDFEQQAFLLLDSSTNRNEDR